MYDFIYPLILRKNNSIFWKKFNFWWIRYSERVGKASRNSKDLRPYKILHPSFANLKIKFRELSLIFIHSALRFILFTLDVNNKAELYGPQPIHATDKMRPRKVDNSRREKRRVSRFFVFNVAILLASIF